MRRGGAGLFVEFARAAVERNYRRARFPGRHFYVLPADAAAPPGLQSLQRRFFCREARGIMLGGDGAARFTIGPLGLGKHTFSESRRAGDGFPHAANFDNVYANGNDHGRKRTKAATSRRSPYCRFLLARARASACS